MAGVLDRLLRREPIPERVVVVAYPDDEVLAAGSRMALMDDLVVINTTDGAPRDMEGACRQGVGSVEDHPDGALRGWPGNGRALAPLPRATPFQHPGWLIPWTRHHAPGRCGAVALRAGGRLVGLNPVFAWEGAALLAGPGPSDRGDALLAPGFETTRHASPPCSPRWRQEAPLGP